MYNTLFLYMRDICICKGQNQHKIPWGNEELREQKGYFSRCICLGPFLHQFLGMGDENYSLALVESKQTQQAEGSLEVAVVRRGGTRTDSLSQTQLLQCFYLETVITPTWHLLDLTILYLFSSKTPLFPREKATLAYVSVQRINTTKTYRKKDLFKKVF